MINLDSIQTPQVELNLRSASNDAFYEAIERFRNSAKTLPTPPNLELQDGWIDLTPKLAACLLMRTAGNRDVTFSRAKTYAIDIGDDDWGQTHQGLGVNTDGRLDDGQHRCWAVYFTGKTVRTYLVASLPVQKNLFAYLDQGGVRSYADAVTAAGGNGYSKIIAAVVKDLSVRYDNKAMSTGARQPKFRRVDQREMLAYLEAHPEVNKATRFMMETYPLLVSLIGSKTVAVEFARRVLDRHDKAALNEYCENLSGGELGADDPVRDVRTRLVEESEKQRNQRLKPPQVLALLILSFNMHQSGERLAITGRKKTVQPLTLPERFPEVVEPLSEAA